MTDPLIYFRQELNELRTRVERNETKLGYVEDASKGSLSSKEARAETLAFIKSDIRNIFEELEKLQKSKEKLDDRFFSLWVSIFLLGAGVVVDFLVSR